MHLYDTTTRSKSSVYGTLAALNAFYGATQITHLRWANVGIGAEGLPLVHKPCPIIGHLLAGQWLEYIYLPTIGLM
jgi:hypothetical protein